MILRKTFKSGVISIYTFLVISLSITYNVFADSKIVLPEVKRLSGLNRYETAIDIAKYGWQNSDYAIIATGENFADALCAVPLSYKYKAPILFTDSKNLNNLVENQLKNMGVKKVFIVGGQGVVSKQIEIRLDEIGIKYERFGGKDRYETSILIAEQLGVVNEVVIVSGENFPDALSISSIASQKGIPIILTQKNFVPKITTNYLNKNIIKQTYIIGGEGAVSSSILSLLSNPIRTSGVDRYDTNLAVIKKFFESGLSDNLYIVSGENFPDALAIAALAAKNNAGIILTDDLLKIETQNYIIDSIKKIKKIVVAGGYGAVPDLIINKLYEASNEFEIIDPKKYMIDKVISINNVGSKIVSSLDGIINLGQIEKSQYQQDESFEVYGQDIKYLKNQFDEYEATIKVGKLDAKSSIGYRIIRKFKSGGIKYNIDLKNTSGNYNGFAEYLKYTLVDLNIKNKDKFIEDENNRILKLIADKTKEVVKDETNPYIKAKKIFEFVNTYITYDSSSLYANKGALNAFVTKRGVCQEFAELFATMNKMAGVPTREVYGFWVPDQITTAPYEAIYNRHIWTEFYLPEYGWIVADPTKQETDLNGKKIPALDYFAGLPNGDHFLEGYNDYRNKYNYYGDDNQIKDEEQPYIKEIKK